MSEESKVVPLSQLGGLPRKRLPAGRVAIPSPAEEGGTSCPSGDDHATGPFWNEIQLVLPSSPSPMGTLACPVCGTRIASMSGGLRGGCPSCGNWIDCTPQVASPFTIVDPNLTGTETVDSHSPLRPFPVEVKESIPVASQVGTPSTTIDSPPATPAQLRDAKGSELVPSSLSSKRPEARRIVRSGKVSFKTLAEVIQPRQELDFETAPAAPRAPEDGADPPELEKVLLRQHQGRGPSPIALGKKTRWLRRLGVLSAVFFVLGGIIYGVVILSSPKRVFQERRPLSAKELQKFQQTEAKACFNRIFSSKDSGEISASVIGGIAKQPVIRRALKSYVFPEPGDDTLITLLPLADVDVKRGLTAFLYEAPPDKSPSFEPILSTEMLLGIHSPGPLEEYAMASAVENFLPARKGLAMFSSDGAKTSLDWDLFMQTWNRTLQSFEDGEAESNTGRFRVVISLDKPVFENGESSDELLVRISDPCHTEDVIRVPVKRHAPEAFVLRSLLRDGTALSVSRNATVDLRRESDSGKVLLDGIVCWEFLGLGGTEGNTSAGIDAQR